MPYLRTEQRIGLQQSEDDGFDALVTTGELAYKIVEQIHRFTRGKNECYDMFASVLGVLESVKLEYYRDIVGPYEEKKKQENGGVNW